MAQEEVVAGKRRQLQRVFQQAGPGRKTCLLYTSVSGVADIPEWLAGAVDLFPDHLGQLENGRAHWGRKVEILVQGGRVFDANANSAGQVSAIGVVPYLLAVAKNMQRILALDQLLHLSLIHI